jgi:hypothetical protein
MSMYNSHRQRVLAFVLGFLSCLLLPFGLRAEKAPTLDWQHTLGGSLDDKAQFIIPTSDGGYLMVGRSMSKDGDLVKNRGNFDAWVVTLTSTGGVTWQNTYGGKRDDEAFSVVAVADGYLVAGISGSIDGDITDFHGGSGDAWVFKINLTGVLQWSKTYGGSLDDGAHSIVDAGDGSFVVAGYTFSNDGDVTGGVHGGVSDDYWVFKINGSGVLAWQKTYGGSSADQANQIIKTIDGGFAVVGNSESADGDVTGLHGQQSRPDFWVVKLSSSGSLIWQKTYGGSGEDIAESIVETLDSGYAIAGYTTSDDFNVKDPRGDYDCWVIKVRKTGTLQWATTLGGMNQDQAFSIVNTRDSGFAILSTTLSNDSDVKGLHNAAGAAGDLWVTKLTPVGYLAWQKTLGGSAHDEGSCILATSDRGYLVVGMTKSTDSDVTGQHGGGDAWIVKLKADPSEVAPNTASANISLSIFPNPSNTIAHVSYTLEHATQIRMTLYNVIGEPLGVIVDTREEAGSHTAAIDLSHFPSGEYFLKSTVGARTELTPITIRR